MRRLFHPTASALAAVAASGLAFFAALLGDATSTRADADIIHRSPKPVWMEANVGFSYIDLGGLSFDNLLPPSIDHRTWGGAGGAAAGLAFDFFTVGTRFSAAAYKDFGLGSVTLEGGVRLRQVDSWELYTRAGAGYAWMLNAASDEISKLSINGWTLILGIGCNVYPSRSVSVGAGVNFSTLSLSRSGYQDANPTNPEYLSLRQPGSAGSIQLSVQVLTVTLHL